MFTNDTIRIKIGNDISHDNGTRFFGNRDAFNKIKTTDYTLLTFLPMNIFNQFCRVANCYFLIISIIAFFLMDCPISPLATLIPLIVIVTLAIIKQIPEFYFRRKSDGDFNHKMVTIIRQGRPLNIESQYIEPGDLVIIKDKSDVPCDMILLQTTNENGKCFVTTANLDGETNLRTLHLPHGLSKFNISDLRNLGFIECESPTTDLYSFRGKLETHSDTIPLTADNLLLHGVRIENTECVVGCAVYLGMQTKLRLNNGRNNHKTSTSEKYINTYVSGFIITMLIFVTVLYLFQRNDEIVVVPLMTYLGPPLDVNSAAVIFNEFFCLLMLFTYMIPLPLYVIIEVYRVMGACFMHWDTKLYDEASDQPCIPRTSDLIEELGQINFLFMDKTGTITKNEMTLQRCSISGRKYALQGSCLEALDNGETYNSTQLMPDHKNFFKALALCHTIDIADSEAQSTTQSINELSCNDIILDVSSTCSEVFSSNLSFNYQATSPDEMALVNASAQLGVQYLGVNNDDVLTIRQQISDTRYVDSHYQRLHILEFTPERKRMSVIVEDQRGLKWIYTKGADSSVLPLCESNEFSQLEQTKLDLSEFGCEGLRTLVVASKQISKEDYEEFLQLDNSANNSLNQRDELKEKSYATVERDLNLLGATAVEVALQDDVAQTLVSLRLAGIKVWMLTGDKVETALSTALLSGHIMPDFVRHMILGCSDKRDLLAQFEIVQQFINEGSKIALTLDNQSLDVILTQIPAEFRDIAMKCSAVICCRVNPAQKSQIVHLIKNSPERFITAAVGDGANDVSMLQDANVGIAVRSKEDNQAFCGSDYAVAKFSMLRRLLLVHGHYSTTRLSLLVVYYFYQNVLLSSAMLLFQFNNMHSGSSLYDTVLLIMYTTLYNSLPAMVISFTEKPYSEDALMKFPELYTRVGRYRSLSWPVFLFWTVDGFLHSTQVFCSVYFLFSTNNVILSEGQTAGLSCFGTLIMQCVVIIGNLKLMIETKYMSYWYVGSVAFSLGTFILSTYIDNIINSVSDSGMFWAYNELLSSLPAWLFTIIMTTACLFPDFGLRYLRESFKLPQTWSFAQSGFVRTLQDFNILSSDELRES